MPDYSQVPHTVPAPVRLARLVETAKANNLEPYAYLQHVVAHIATADTLEKLEALLSCNLEVED